VASICGRSVQKMRVRCSPRRVSYGLVLYQWCTTPSQSSHAQSAHICSLNLSLSLSLLTVTTLCTSITHTKVSPHDTAASATDTKAAILSAAEVILRPRVRRASPASQAAAVPRAASTRRSALQTGAARRRAVGQVRICQPEAAPRCWQLSPAHPTRAGVGVRQVRICQERAGGLAAAQLRSVG
jgi:hypothetical protein